MVRRVVALGALVACRDPAESARPQPVPAVAPTVHDTPVAAVAPEDAGVPLAADHWIQTLAADGVTDYACPPVGARESRPVVIALHGMDARPEWVCNDFHATFGPWPWVICAQGDAPTRQNWSWGSTAAMRKAAARVLERVKARWPEYVRDDGRVLVTYSLSASMAPALLADDGALSFESAFFLEGFSKHLPMYAQAIAKHGLRRATFFSMQPGNRAPADRSAAALRRAGVTSFSTYGGALGHWFGPKTVPALRLAVPDTVRDLPAWATYPGVPE